MVLVAAGSAGSAGVDIVAAAEHVRIAAAVQAAADIVVAALECAAVVAAV
jgi:hypothetical protein